jgi:hypothetical protein
MRSVYRVLAFVVAAEVVVQAAAIAFAVYGLATWVDDGGRLDKALLEREDGSVGGAAGFAIHGANGTMVVPLLALLLLIVSFFAGVPGGATWAGAVFALVVVQAALGFLGQGLPAVGALHGATALVLFGVAVMAGKRVGPATAPEGVSRATE